MKKFIKYLLVIAGLLFVLGACGGVDQGTMTMGQAVVRCIAGGAMGLIGMAMFMEERHA